MKSSLCDRWDLVNFQGRILKFDSGEGPFFDDLTKQQLPTALVKAARKKELDYFESKNVWQRVSIDEAWRISGRPPITVRWVDVNKGDDETPDIRSRLVARQIRGANEDPMFAPTPHWKLFAQCSATVRLTWATRSRSVEMATLPTAFNCH